MDKIVYVVIHGACDDTWVEAVFSTRELAEKFIEQQVVEYREERWIEEYILDKPEPIGDSEREINYGE